MKSMNYQRPGYRLSQSRVSRNIQAVEDRKMREQLRGEAHYFKIFTMGLDMCARCQKPRSEHPRAPR